MRYFIRILLFSSVLFVACSKKENEVLLKELNDIKAMGDTLPQAAMRRLDSIKPQFDNETEYMCNKLALLEIRLQDKAYITHTTDKQIKDICRYFEENGTSIEKQEAYYYMGSVYRDLNDYPNAVTFFLKSAAIAEETSNADVALWGNSYSQLSHLYRTQLNYTEALDVALKRLEVAERNDNANNRTYMTIASCYSKLNDTINSVKFYNLIINNLNNAVIDRKNADIIATAMGDYALYGYKDEATHCYELLNRLNKKERPFNYLSNLSVYYECFVSIDSAAVARLELYNTTSRIESKYDASQWLTRYYASIKDYEKATEFAIKFIDANLAVNNKRNLEHTTNAKNFFQYRRDKEEEPRVMQNAAKDRYNLVIGVSISIIVLLGTVTLHYRRKKRLLDIILNKEKNIESAKVLIEKRDFEIEREKRCIEEKEKELRKLNAANSRLSKELQNAKEDFDMLVAQNCELTKLTIMNNMAKSNGDIIEKVKKTSKGKYHLSDDEWKELLGAIDKLYPEFTHEVQAKFKKINEPLLRVCYLLKIGLTGPEIANITDYPRQTVWDRIKKVKETIKLGPTSSQRN